MTKITLLGKPKLQPYQCKWDGRRVSSTAVRSVVESVETLDSE
jgi:hypothetical protein